MPVSRWQRFWWDPADPRVLAALRIGWALLCLRAYLPLWGELEFLFTDAGMLSLEQRAESYGPERWSVLSGISELGGVQAVFIGMFVCWILTASGLGTRVVMPLAWIGLVSLYNRNAAYAAGSDSVLRVLGFYLLFLPTSRAWSLDRWIADRMGWAMKREGPPGVMLRLFQLNVCVVYVCTGVLKLLEDPWVDGTAVYKSLATEHYWRFNLTRVLAHPITKPLTVAMTWVTLAWELTFPLVFIKKLRPWVLLAGVGLHLGIVLCLNIGPFSEVMMWSYLAFLAFRRTT